MAVREPPNLTQPYTEPAKPCTLEWLESMPHVRFAWGRCKAFFHPYPGSHAGSQTRGSQFRSWTEPEARPRKNERLTRAQVTLDRRHWNFEPVGREFESLRAHHSSVSQSVDCSRFGMLVLCRQLAIVPTFTARAFSIASRIVCSCG